LNYTINLPLNYKYIRLNDVTGASASTDVVSIHARLGNV
jgi:hypothetical protein